MIKLAGVCTAVLVAAAGLAFAQSSSQPALTIHTLSSDPSRVTGGDALVEILGDGALQPAHITVNGRDVSNEFHPTGSLGRQLGLVTGLDVGKNTIEAVQGNARAKLILENYPITGPVFAGPKEKPFYCETESFKLADGTHLPAPKDADCSVDTVVSYVYKAIGEDGFKPLPSRTELPKDIDHATTMTAGDVPYVVRVETGTIDRGIYQIAVLHDPTTESAPTPARAPKAWNNRLVYVFAGGCLGMYQQGAKTGNILDPQFLGLGYMTASNSLNVFATNCDDLLSAEAAMMTRERAIEMAGLPVYTLGWGCSGGSHQVLLIADNFPGVLDGIVPMCNSVDGARFQQFYTDVRLLYDWFAQPAGAALSDAQKVAIAGVPLTTAASELARSIASSCPDVVPQSVVYDRKSNPNGVRCTSEEHQVNSIGRNPNTGHAWSLADNIGVQYGLGALNAGAITVDQFLDLNEQIGGYDADGERAPQRAVGDESGIEAFYRSGRVLNAGGGLRDIPILELRNYSDLDKRGAHTKYGTYVAVARLVREAGMRANYVILLESHREGFMSASRVGGDSMSHYALAKMDEWLTAVANDAGADSKSEKVARLKPVDLVDSCYDDSGNRIVEEQTVHGGKCNAMYPTHLPPRMVAGGPLTNDVLKCQLKPVSADDYRVAFSKTQWKRLETIFEQGVCDWSKPGVGQVKPAGTWQSF